MWTPPGPPDCMEELVSRCSPTEQASINAFQRSQECDALTAIWYLREHGFQNVRKAVVAFQETLAWRRAQGIDEGRSRPLPLAVRAALERSFSPLVLNTVDRAGRPIMYTPCSEVNLAHLQRCGVTMDMLVYRYALAAEGIRLAVGQAADPLAGHLQVRRALGASSPAASPRSPHCAPPLTGPHFSRPQCTTPMHDPNARPPRTTPTHVPHARAPCTTPMHTLPFTCCPFARLVTRSSTAPACR